MAPAAAPQSSNNDPLYFEYEECFEDTGDFVATFNACASPKEVSKAVNDAELTVENASQLLYLGGERVSVELLGQCLGHHGDFGKELALCYPSQFTEFTGTDVVSALRTYLWRFRLPGEAAQIERVVEGFAQAYFLRNQVQVKANEDSNESTTCVEPTAHGWYVKQPRTRNNMLCCVHCGTIEGQEENELRVCQGCGVVHFCRSCSRHAHKLGHAIGCRIGYGRACVHACKEAGLLGEDCKMTYGHMGGKQITREVHVEKEVWEKGSPTKSQDSVMVLAYAIIMLSTNLHNANVKQKMEVHEFLRQNRTVNDGANFPGDYLFDIYTSIKAEELKVMKEC
eukprot:gnl/MRDRNA2_/MRDRNA2_93019_c0_seq1.p1 gnl/MRDRNA2_/MRDRNA2_93019_c0~~gnl/MRDRNA2_/MRDRNA2_93019_c0_seq1.p1  ORF type:complete len:339 (+),score=64.36 gnl/MRDRNA2_/MRDRNA2_93019_c0_seq1:76-1092(+)